MSRRPHFNVHSMLLLAPTDAIVTLSSLPAKKQQLVLPPNVRQPRRVLMYCPEGDVSKSVQRNETERMILINPVAKKPEGGNMNSAKPAARLVEVIPQRGGEDFSIRGTLVGSSIIGSKSRALASKRNPSSPNGEKKSLNFVQRSLVPYFERGGKDSDTTEENKHEIVRYKIAKGDVLYTAAGEDIEFNAYETTSENLRNNEDGY
ncbi:unnamed protein product [Cyprideis torosa]|uniref:Uncharacterized protein n=1 Tax=Cyprideis torosa TaxID=163714 RepID=A0A7R8W3G2_9CRUS|nr:unnamed protein product [Cyprideis torosa]CAG0880844.1 unnamed protein product [Cyprideis torosa]